MGRLVELEETEIKMLLVAIRQVQHTFNIAEAQSAAGGQSLPGDYSNIQEAYERLSDKLSTLMDPPEQRKPFIVE